MLCVMLKHNLQAAIGMVLSSKPDKRDIFQWMPASQSIACSFIRSLGRQAASIIVPFSSRHKTWPGYDFPDIVAEIGRVEIEDEFFSDLLRKVGKIDCHAAARPSFGPPLRARRRPRGSTTARSRRSPGLRPRRAARPFKTCGSPGSSAIGHGPRVAPGDRWQTATLRGVGAAGKSSTGWCRTAPGCTAPAGGDQQSRLAAELTRRMTTDDDPPDRENDEHDHYRHARRIAHSLAAATLGRDPKRSAKRLDQAADDGRKRPRGEMNDVAVVTSGTRTWGTSQRSKKKQETIAGPW